MPLNGLQAEESGEYGLEVQFPFIARALEGQEASIVPILVGAAMTAESEAVYGRILAPYVNDPSTMLIVSTDLCHFGDEFDFTAPATVPLTLSSSSSSSSSSLSSETAIVPSSSSSSSPSKKGQPAEQPPPPQSQHNINLEIARLDALTMRAIESRNPTAFTRFLDTQKNSGTGHLLPNNAIRF
jgi:AmmeMemoRadiSam system protein B